MRFPYSGVLGSLFLVSACATGETLDKRHVALIDAGFVQPPDESGGAGNGEGGAATGGDVSGGVPAASGGVIGSGGSGSGGKASGGAPGTGGKASGGGGAGASASGGASSGGAGSGGKGTGGASSGGATPDDGGSCQTGEKFCGGLCTPPAPRVGCGLTGCTACTLTAPANGYVTCTMNQCAFDCLSGYTKMGSMCTGTGAGGGGGGNCKPASCPACNVVSGPACCTSAGACGCPLIPWVAPTCI